MDSTNHNTRGHSLGSTLTASAVVVWSLSIVWWSAAWGAEYLSLLNADCGTGRLSILGTLTLMPFLAAVPACLGSMRAGAAARCATLAALSASVFANVFVMVAGHLR